MAGRGSGSKPQLVIFLRAPLRGAVKRRLAGAVGARVAHDFYIHNSRAVVQRLGNDTRWRTVLAVTPDRFAAAGRFWATSRIARCRMGQGFGHLGDRMGRVFAALPPGPVVLIGSDIPGINRALIHEAFQKLRRWEAVFGPAADGGYWLVGLARRRIDPKFLARRLFAGVRWSGPHALADTRANLPEGAEAPEIAMLEDVDDGAAYARWVARELRIN